MAVGAKGIHTVHLNLLNYLPFRYASNSVNPRSVEESHGGAEMANRDRGGPNSGLFLLVARQLVACRRRTNPAPPGCTARSLVHWPRYCALRRGYRGTRALQSAQPQSRFSTRALTVPRMWRERNLAASRELGEMYSFSPGCGGASDIVLGSAKWIFYGPTYKSTRAVRLYSRGHIIARTLRLRRVHWRTRRVLTTHRPHAGTPAVQAVFVSTCNWRWKRRRQGADGFPISAGRGGAPKRHAVHHLGASGVLKVILQPTWRSLCRMRRLLQAARAARLWWLLRRPSLQ